MLFDAVVSACTFSGESWLEAAGAVHAENEVLRFLATAAGMPDEAGGCFVSGGSAGDLSALAVARDTQPRARNVVVADTAHSSVANALARLDLGSIVVPTEDAGRLRADALSAVDAADVAAVVLFRRHGWDEAAWVAWSRCLLADGVAFVTPTRWKGEPVGRLVFLHPETDPAVVDGILTSLRRDDPPRPS